MGAQFRLFSLTRQARPMEGGFELLGLPNTCLSGSLAPEASCTVEVQFSPTVAQVYSATLCLEVIGDPRLEHMAAASSYCIGLVGNGV